jgi:hypothetical protein
MQFDKEDHMVAVHEAAHAVAAWASGFLLVHVSMFGRLDTPGSLGHCRYRTADGGPKEEAGVSMAPAILENIEKGQIGLASLMDVYDAVKKLASAGDMAVDAVRLLKSYPDDWQAVAQEFYALHAYRVKTFLENKAFIIHQLAEELSKRGGQMSGYETAYFLENAWPDEMPKTARPAKDHVASEVPEKSKEQAFHLARAHLICALDALDEVADKKIKDARLIILEAVFKWEAMFSGTHTET